MKKLLLIITLCVSLFAQEEPIQENLKKYLTGVPTTQCMDNLNLGNYVKKTDSGNYAFMPILDGVNFQTGRLTYKIYAVDESYENLTITNGINSPIDTISFTNPSCRDYSKVSKDDFDQLVQQYNLSEQFTNRKSEYINTQLKGLHDQYLGKNAEFKEVGDKKYLTTASYLLACLTFNESIIDIKQSLQLNRIILKPGYTIHPNAQVERTEIREVSKGFSSIASSIKKKVEVTYNDVILASVSDFLSKNVILFLFDFRSRWNDIILEMKTFLFLTFIPFSIGFLSLNKITKKISNIHDFDDYVEKGVMVVILLFIFYFTNGTTNKVEYPNGESENINLSNFQKFSSNFFDKSMEYANKSANVFSSSYIDFKRKSAGYLTEQEIKNIVINTVSAKNIINELNTLENACKRDWDTSSIKIRFNIDSKLYDFPNNSQIKRFMETPTNNLMDFRSQTLKDMGSSGYPLTSLLACYTIQNEKVDLKKQIEDNEKILGASALTDTEQEEADHLIKIAKVQYYSTAEQGFLSIPQVAVTNIVTDSLGMFKADPQRTDIKSHTEEIKNMNNIDGGFENVQTLFGSLAYMMVPGANAIKEFVSDAGSGFFEKVPFVGKLVGSLVGTGVAVTIMEQLVTYLPVIALSMASLMVIGWFFISVFIYFLVSPFIIVYAMSQQQTEIIKDFLIRGVALSFKPILIILSVVVTIVAVDLFKDLSIILFDTNFALLIDVIKAKTWAINPLDWFFMFLKGVLAVGTSIVATVSAFYLVFNGAEMILGMFGFKQSGIDVKEVVGGAVEGKTSKYNNPGA